LEFRRDDRNRREGKCNSRGDFNLKLGNLGKKEIGEWDEA